MAGENGSRGSWWATLPGFLTALGGLVAAVASLVVALNQAGLFDPSPPPAAATSTAEPGASPDRAAPPPLRGKTIVVDGNDHILIAQEPLGEPAIQVALQVAPNIDWWKSIVLLDAHGEKVSLLSTQDADKGPKRSNRFDARRFGNSVTIEFWKAKTLGVHTRVDTAQFEKAALAGFLTTFDWQND